MSGSAFDVEIYAIGSLRLHIKVDCFQSALYFFHEVFSLPVPVAVW